ncbi:MAG: alpha/beta hydrolase [Chloroflexi bacterium]|nr:alpha/beta hydrolase [Chloroflexota bacterium]
MRKRVAPLVALLACLALVAAACSSSSGTSSSGGRSVLFRAQDGVVLHGTIYGDSLTMIILAHSLNSDQKSWGQFPDILTNRGYSVLTFDFRGHGASPAAKEPGIADADLAAALDFARNTQGLGRHDVYVIGSNMGATAAIKVASREQVKALVALSPGVNIRGLTAVPDIDRVEEPKLFIAAQNDTQGAQDAQTLYDRAHDPRQIQIVPGNDVGTDLLKGVQGDKVRTAILDFFGSNR